VGRWERLGDERGRRLRRALLDFGVRELPRDRTPEAGEQRLEELKAFRLGFVQRVALRVAAEADHRSEMIESSRGAPRHR